MYIHIKHGKLNFAVTLMVIFKNTCNKVHYKQGGVTLIASVLPFVTAVKIIQFYHGQQSSHYAQGQTKLPDIVSAMPL